MNFFVTAIGTDSGKTLVSAIVCEALGADYWKPVQAGLPRDFDTVRTLVSRPGFVCYPEQYLLKTPASPHAAARIDNVAIKLTAFKLPRTARPLVVEGAGGCLVPLNNDDLMVDLMAALDSRVIVVSNHYLGSINHTLLTLEALTRRNLRIEGIIFNGEKNSDTEDIILYRSGLKCLLRIAPEPVIDAPVVKRYADLLKANWHG